MEGRRQKPIVPPLAAVAGCREIGALPRRPPSVRQKMRWWRSTPDRAGTRECPAAHRKMPWRGRGRWFRSIRVNNILASSRCWFVIRPMPVFSRISQRQKGWWRVKSGWIASRLAHDGAGSRPKPSPLPQTRQMNFAVKVRRAPAAPPPGTNAEVKIRDLKHPSGMPERAAGSARGEQRPGEAGDGRNASAPHFLDEGFAAR